mgnify:CR=1 FL=1
MTDQVSGTASRRNFLAIAGGAAVGSAAILVPQAATPVTAAELAANHQGYRETTHVQTFYQLARF